MAGKFSSFFKGFQGGTVFRNLRHKKIVSGLLALCIHIDSYLAYICAEGDLPLIALRYCIKASLMTFLVENDVCSLKIIQVQNFIDNNVS